MLIVCPSCASQYELDAAKLGPAGRKVRCAGCQTSWHVEAALEVPVAPTAEETKALLNDELEQAALIEAQVTALAAERGEASDLEAADVQDNAQDHDVAPPRPKRAPARKARGGAAKPATARFGGMFAPAALTLAGVVLAGTLVWQRDLAVRGAPQLAVLFEKIGLPVNVRGLSLTAVESGLVEDGQGRFLVVEGDVTNIAKGSTRVPLIEVAVKDASGQTLYTWTTEPPRPNLEPSELMRFRARLASPPANGQSVQVRFTSEGPANLASVR
ncbi:zinc-ribbon domain-containing protein [Bosea lathyri]|uniref:MJ0042 family finger-like domain-containing protein n=1 Tax=Bosea lathyri TaxID=1036778 RepID=A0A1H6CT83_9HYPH|nr:DUF3426 domain-containing protein [Bosea lathyri]SEG76249.1 MJ0042 family finger-like domain-containing protein [Bosea lathyri]